MSLRRRVALELATLAVLTPVFLVLVPERPVWVDAGLVLFIRWAFILWAALQQVLFQFYLLGRLRALIPAAPRRRWRPSTGSSSAPILRYTPLSRVA